MNSETAAWSGRRPSLRASRSEGLSLPAPPAWTEQGLCGQTDPELFYPDKGGSTASAKKVCGLCDVRADCLAYALANGERFGIWGGKSERERRRLGATA